VARTVNRKGQHLRRGDFELTVAYEPAERGWLTASIPAVPGTISTGRTRDEARDNALDALRTMLAAPVGAVHGRDVEIIRVCLERSDSATSGADGDDEPVAGPTHALGGLGHMKALARPTYLPCRTAARRRIAKGDS
jgi:predicted RNase H-like HicB family nuclease